jgi:hypothetical protein
MHGIPQIFCFNEENRYFIQTKTTKHKTKIVISIIYSCLILFVKILIHKGENMQETKGNILFLSRILRDFNINFLVHNYIRNV